MGAVWKIAPGEKAFLWEDFYRDHYISINWQNDTDFSSFTLEQLKELLPGNGANQVWRFVREVKPGQTVVANEGNSKVRGIGVVQSPYLHPNHRKNPRRTEREHRHVHLVDWEIDSRIDLPKEFFGHIPPAVKQLTPEQCRLIKRAYLEKDPNLKDKLDRLLPDTVEEPPKPMIDLLQQFRQVILYGPPGTGKTREAKRVALGLLTGEDVAADEADSEVGVALGKFREAGKYDIVVFHPAYEYEQFVGGIAPVEERGELGFRSKMGPFLKLCRKAEQTDEPAVLVIDEINRGNLPKLLGELVYALEYRGERVRLPFSCDGRDDLVIPPNLFVIGTMNSSDRSIGHIDVAIRRRFGLVLMEPKSDVVRQVWSAAGDASFGEQLASLMDQLNEKLRGHDAIAAAELGVGQSYFLPAPGSSGEVSMQQVRLKWEFQVQPLLKEYAQLLSANSTLDEFFRPMDECLS